MAPDPSPSNVGIPRHRIEHLAALGDDWDSYGGKPPTEEALRAARFLNTVPTPDGGIQFEWHANGWDVEIEVGPDGRPEFWAHHKGSGEMLSAGVAAGPQATPDPLWEGPAEELDAVMAVGTQQALGCAPTDRVRVVAVPTDHEDPTNG